MARPPGPPSAIRVEPAAAGNDGAPAVGFVTRGNAGIPSRGQSTSNRELRPAAPARRCA